MRWPLRNQILLPMIGLILAALISVSMLNAYFSVRRTRSRIENELAQVIETLAKSNFPLTNNVLQQMGGLVGAEFILTDRDGNILASSTESDALLDLPSTTEGQQNSVPTLSKPIKIGDRSFFHTGAELRRFSGPAPQTTLHILYPEESYHQAWRDVVYPPLLVGAVTIVLVVGVSLGIASRVTRPLSRLQRQVDEIATGNFRSVPIPERNDETADLSRAINHMAERLAQYETEVRRNEQLRTLGQLGGGIAHQIRNSVTGCRLAVDLHARECLRESESLNVAMRQLELMEKFLQRFLALGRSETKQYTPICLQPIVENVISLVNPTARHIGVALEWNLPDEPVEICGDADALEQLLVNLVLNGIEAASQLCEQDEQAGRSTPVVNISLRQAGDRAKLAIQDTGHGPAANIETRLFEPFVTEKPSGTGLGLTVALEIATAHGGEIYWYRSDAATNFVVELPVATASEETQVGEERV